MKILSALFLMLVITGCSTTHELPPVEQKVAERVEYLVRVPPAELLELPVEPVAVDVDKASQADIARWLIENEKYVREIKRRLVEIAKFLKNEQSKADEEAKKKNTEAGTLTDSTKVVNLPEKK